MPMPILPLSKIAPSTKVEPFHFGMRLAVVLLTCGSVSAPAEAICQLAKPVASEVSTLPAPGLPPVIFTCPTTSRLVEGVAVPMPNRPLLLSQKKVLLFCEIKPPVPAKSTEPGVMLVNARVPPMVALLVTLSAVPADVNEAAPNHVLAPDTVCAVPRSTKVCVTEPVPPLAKGNAPVKVLPAPVERLMAGCT